MKKDLGKKWELGEENKFNWQAADRKSYKGGRRNRDFIVK